MWFRVEIRKDGGIASCEQVSGSIGEQGSSVFYVEAESKEAAIALSAERWRERKRAREQALKELREKADRITGLCACGNPLEPFRAKCRACLDAYREKYPPGRITKPRVAVGAQEARERARAVAIRYGSRVETLRLVLAQFDAGTPASFRAWLSGYIQKLEARADLRQRRRAALAANGIDRASEVARRSTERSAARKRKLTLKIESGMWCTRVRMGNGKRSRIRICDGSYSQETARKMLSAILSERSSAAAAAE